MKKLVPLQRDLKLKIKGLFTSRFTLHASRSRGQAMPYFFMMMVVLVLCWAMIVNISKLLKDRMMMQNAADNAALSVAVYKARLLNKLGELNFLIGCALYGTEFGVTNYHNFGVGGGVYGVCSGVGAPILPMVMVDNQQKIACIGDMVLTGIPKCASGTGNGSGEASQTVSAIRNLVKGMVTVQDSLRLPFPGLAVIYANKIAKRQELNANGDECGADLVAVTSGLSLGLERNENGIKYFKTKATYISIPPIPIVLPPGLHVHIWNAEDYAEEQKSWLYADKDKFYKDCKITVVATKYGDSDSNKGYPLIGNWFGINWPMIMTTASAGVYNTEGIMFPEETKGSPSDKISPVIKEYRKAEKGGWDAHLVPVGGGLKH